TVRFIGELVKFGLFPLADAAADLKLLIINFSHHSIELACTLLESCGRCTLRNLWNKKTKMVTDERLSAMIENAYYSVAPPDANSRFLQRLLFKDLCNSTVEKVLNLCLRLPWTDPKISQFAVRCFTSVWCIPYSSVHCLASVLAGLAPYQPSVAIAVVDNVLEDIRLGMEINETRLNQRRIACSRYLGELYNYCLTCGQYFDTGSNKKRLDAYLLYLQQYYWSKRRQLVWSSEDRPFPLDIEYLYTETVDSLRPKFKHANNFQEARLLVDKQEKAFLAKLERVAAKLQQQSDTAARGEDDADRASSNSATPQRRQSPRPELMACPEDEEFVRAFERTLAVEGGVGGGGVGGGVGGPPGFLSASGDPNSVACASNSPAADAPAAGTVAFTVMARRGGSSRNQPVVRLPADSHLARRYLAAVEADAREREAVKRATLSITEAQMRRDEAADEAAAAAAIADAEVPHLIGHRQRGGGGGRWQHRQGGAGSQFEQRVLTAALHRLLRTQCGTVAIATLLLPLNAGCVDDVPEAVAPGVPAVSHRVPQFLTPTPPTAAALPSSRTVVCRPELGEINCRCTPVSALHFSSSSIVTESSVKESRLCCCGRWTECSCGPVVAFGIRNIRPPVESGMRRKSGV
uniref:MIF4G domain-containing protein n=1 Tax=Macrostomum lignano TaxID=282301 RepID=A0A1I8IW96_9PLAT